VQTGRRQRGGLEHEVIAVLAAHGGPMTPGQVREALAADLAYTTVMTVLARLCDKGVVTRRRSGRAFAYQAVLDEDEIAARQMQRLLDTRSDRAAVLSRFVGTLSDDDERLLVDLLHRTEASDTETSDTETSDTDSIR
jgi:predicted transcriptional regulator